MRITQVQLTHSDSNTLDGSSYDRYGSTFEGEFRACQRYYEKSYNVNDPPGTVAGSYCAGFATASGAFVYSMPFKSIKRATPTTVVYNPNSGATGSVYTYQLLNVTAIIGGTTQGYTLNNNASAAAGVGYSFHWTADSEF